MLLIIVLLFCISIIIIIIIIFVVVIFLIITSIYTGAIASVCTHILNMHDIMLVVDDIVILLS